MKIRHPMTLRHPVTSAKVLMHCNTPQINGSLAENDSLDIPSSRLRTDLNRLKNDFTDIQLTLQIYNLNRQTPTTANV